MCLGIHLWISKAKTNRDQKVLIAHLPVSTGFPCVMEVKQTEISNQPIRCSAGAPTFNTHCMTNQCVHSIAMGDNWNEHWVHMVYHHCRHSYHEGTRAVLLLVRAEYLAIALCSLLSLGVFSHGFWNKSWLVIEYLVIGIKIIPGTNDDRMTAFEVRPLIETNGLNELRFTPINSCYKPNYMQFPSSHIWVTQFTLPLVSSHLYLRIQITKLFQSKFSPWWKWATVITLSHSQCWLKSTDSSLYLTAPKEALSVSYKVQAVSWEVAKI